MTNAIVKITNAFLQCVHVLPTERNINFTTGPRSRLQSTSSTRYYSACTCWTRIKWMCL